MSWPALLEVIYYENNTKENVESLIRLAREGEEELK